MKELIANFYEDVVDALRAIVEEFLPEAIAMLIVLGGLVGVILLIIWLLLKFAA